MNQPTRATPTTGKPLGSAMPRAAALRYAPWLGAAGLFLVAWASMLTIGDRWGLLHAEWPIALAMALGSYVAGSTPMGGGTVGFPILVLLFDHPATMGRDFSLAIQAVGMTSASIFIFCARKPIAGRVLSWCLAGSAASLPVSLVLIAPEVSGAAVKLTFAVIWGGFGILALVKLRQLLAQNHPATLSVRTDAAVGLAAGLVGGLTTALTGVGIDMVLFTALVLIHRVELRTAIATSVVAMAANSVVGISIQALRQDIQPGVLDAWFAAAPVVLFGAPLGAFAVSRLPRGPTLAFVATLCVGQLVWACVRVAPPPLGLAAVAASVLAINAGFHLMHALGGRLHPASVTPDSV